MVDVEVVVAHRARATLRVGDLFLKVDPDAAGIDAEVAAMALAPVPTPAIVWRHHPVLALSAVPGTALGRLGAPSPASPAAWRAAGAMVRTLHEAPPPPWSGSTREQTTRRLDEECSALVREGVLPAGLVDANRRAAEVALAAWRPVFAHGDLQLTHVFVEDDRVTGVIDWSAAGVGDAHADLAVLTLGHEEHLDDVLGGYGGDVDPDVVRAWWSLRALIAIRWLRTHGFDPFEPGGEVAVLEARARAGG